MVLGKLVKDFNITKMHASFPEARLIYMSLNLHFTIYTVLDQAEIIGIYQRADCGGWSPLVKAAKMLPNDGKHQSGRFIRV